MGRRGYLLGLAAALLLTYPAWREWTDPHLNLLWEDYKGVDDAKNHMLRLYLLGWMVEHGVWLPRWLPDLFMGYGYPLFDFYAPGFYYVALALQALFHLDAWDAYKAGGVLAAVVGASGAYALTTDVWRRPALGVVSAVALLYGPYVFQTNLFQRGDLPEALALALLPWLLLGIWRLHRPLSRGRIGVWLVFTVTAGAAIVLIHNLTAISAAAVAAVWTLALVIASRDAMALARTALAGLAIAGLTAFVWLPAVAERGDVQLEMLLEGHLDYREWLLDLGGHSARQQSSENRQTRVGLIDLHLAYPHQHQFIATLKPSLGQAALGVLALAVVAAGALRRRDTAGSLAPTAALLAIAICSWLLTFTFAEWVWRSVPGFSLLQYPSRLLGPGGVCIAVAGAGALTAPLDWLNRRVGTLPASGVLAVALLGLFANGALAREVPWSDDPRRPVGGQIDARTVWIEEGDKFGGTGTTSGGEFTPRSVEIAVYTAGQRRGRPVFERLYPEADWLGGLFIPVSGDLRFLGWDQAPLSVSLRIANGGSSDGLVGFRQFVFPGWRAWVDGRPTPIGPAPWVEEQQATLGFITIPVPAGEHAVTLAFGPTAARTTAALISLVTLALLASGVWWLAASRPAIAPLALVVVVIAAGGYLTVRALSPAFHRFAVPPAGQGTLLVNVAEAARTGQARVSSPSGASLGPDRFVDVRQLTLTDEDPGRGLAGRSRRQWLYMHPTSEVSVDVTLPSGKQIWFDAAATLDPAVWRADVGDGVTFIATVQSLDGPAAGRTLEVLRQVVNARADPAQRRFVPLEADLTVLAGHRTRLALRTEPRDDLSFDWAGWANPVVVARLTARLRPLQHVLALPQ